MSGRRLKALAELAGMIRDRDLARLAAAAAEARKTQAVLDNQAAALARRGAELSGAPAGTADAALMAGADARWQAQLDRRREALLRQLARQLAAREAVRVAASRALGRADVLDRLARKPR
jgi:hypothetical protein